MTEVSSFRVEPSWYWTQERAELEWDHMWTKVWHMGPREEEIPEEGDVFVHTLGRESLLFVRTSTGEAKGYYNVCRHRGNRLLLSSDGPAYVNQFRCAFHGWCFDIEGNFTHAPYAERFDQAVLADKTRTGLKTFRVESFAGWLWFTLDEEAPGLAEYLGPLAEKLGAYHMEKGAIVDYKTFEFGANWKTVFDAFNESYHFQTLHSDILTWGNEDAPITLLNIHSYMVNEYGRPSKMYPDQETVNPSLKALLEANGIDPETFTGKGTEVRRAVQEAKRAKQAAGDKTFPYAELNDSQLSDAYHYMLFPSTHFNLFPEFYVTLRYRPHPSGDPEKMYFDFIMCAPLAEGETVPPYEHRVVRGGTERVADVLTWGVRQHPIVNQVLDEDVGLVEFVQKGQRSRSFDEGILSSDERRIEHFHRNIDELIRGRSIRDLIAVNPVEPDAHSGS